MLTKPLNSYGLVLRSLYELFEASKWILNDRKLRIQQKDLNFSSKDERKCYGLRTAWRWVNDDRIIIIFIFFWWTISLKKLTRSILISCSCTSNVKSTVQWLFSNRFPGHSHCLPLIRKQIVPPQTHAIGWVCSSKNVSKYHTIKNTH